MPSPLVEPETLTSPSDIHFSVVPDTLIPPYLKVWRDHVNEVERSHRRIARHLQHVEKLLAAVPVLPSGALAADLADEEDHYELMWDRGPSRLTVFIYADGRYDWHHWTDGQPSVSEEKQPVTLISKLAERAREVLRGS